MNHETLIQPDALRELMASGRKLAIFDCSFDLVDPKAGLAQYEREHIPGARHADVDLNLSDKTGTAINGGRHPLPSRERFADWLRSQGLDDDTQVVVYDRQGCNYCGRLWWMLRWCGHAGVAALDGGWQAWVASNGPAQSGPAPALPPVGGFTLRPPLARLVTSADLMANLGRPAQTVVDARAPARFRGEVEPLDPVAGHVPGALNRPFAQNIGPDGRFKSAAELRAEFDALLAGRDPAGVVHHCGSGISAVPNVLAMAVAGLGTSGLYAGSWSEWCSDPSRPVARG